MLGHESVEKSSGQRKETGPISEAERGLSGPRWERCCPPREPPTLLSEDPGSHGRKFLFLLWGEGEHRKGAASPRMSKAEESACKIRAGGTPYCLPPPGIICLSLVFRRTLCLSWQHPLEYISTFASQGYIFLWWQVYSMSRSTGEEMSKSMKPDPSCHPAVGDSNAEQPSMCVTSITGIICTRGCLSPLIPRAGCCWVWYVEHFVWGTCWPGLKVIPDISELGGLSHGYFSILSGPRKSFGLRSGIFKG